MRILITGDILDLERWRGIWYYTYYLIHGLQKKNIEVWVYHCNPKLRWTIHERDFVVSLPTRAFSNYLQSLIFRHPIASLYCNVKIKPDIIHFTGTRYSDISLMILTKNSKVMTVHDLIPILFPEFGKIVKIQQITYLRYAKDKVSKFITVSKNTAKDLMNLLHIPSDRIGIIYPGLYNGYFYTFEGKKKSKESYSSYLREKYMIDRDFILYVGACNPIKNTLRLIQAYYIIKQKGHPHRLVLIIPSFYKAYWRKVLKIIDLLKLAKDIIILKGVPRKDLLKFYSLATLFIYPSLYEGFGSPLLEAMVCECPIVASKTSSIPEVVGNAGVLVNPYNVREIADAIERVLLDEALRDELSYKGLKRVKNFSWEKTVRETIKTYEDVLQEK